MDSARSAVVTRCRDLDANLAFFTDRLGFRIHLVTPADDPQRIVIERDGLVLELANSELDGPIELCLDDAADSASDTLRAPNGSTVRFHPVTDRIVVPASRPSLTVVDSGDGVFGTGRAGMGYRDLLPDRWGGRFIASHITIDEGGEVGDWVHFHRIRFQMIFVAAGWVDVVYEDQGEAFRMHAGDCVLQPPEIRHRVLRSSPGLEVIEIGCPAEHDTIADHDLALPTSALAPNRDFGGQRFVRHVASEAVAEPWISDGFRARDTGIGAATDGLAGAVVVSATPGVDGSFTHDGELAMCVGVSGSSTLDIVGHGPVALDARACVALPPGTAWGWSNATDDHEALVVTLPAVGIVSTAIN